MSLTVSSHGLCRLMNRRRNLARGNSHGLPRMGKKSSLAQGGKVSPVQRLAAVPVSLLYSFYSKLVFRPIGDWVQRNRGEGEAESCALFAMLSGHTGGQSSSWDFCLPDPSMASGCSSLPARTVSPTGLLGLPHPPTTKPMMAGHLPFLLGSRSFLGGLRGRVPRPAPFGRFQETPLFCCQEKLGHRKNSLSVFLQIPSLNLAEREEAAIPPVSPGKWRRVQHMDISLQSGSPGEVCWGLTILQTATRRAIAGTTGFITALRVPAQAAEYLVLGCGYLACINSAGVFRASEDK